MADSDNSAACFIHPQKATDNYLRAVKLLSKVCIEIVRILFSFYIPPNSLKDTLQRNRCILEYKLLNEEKTLIYPNARVNPLLTAKDFDIGVMIKILKELNCIKPYSHGWVKKPREGDTSIAACMQIIKNGRDEISHTTDGELSDEKFENIWKKLEFAVVEMEKRLIGGTFFKKAVEYVKTCKLDQSEEDQHDNKTSNDIDSDGTAIETGEAYISDMGLEIRFAKLFKEIAKSIPQDKLEEMKDIIQISCKDVNTVDLKRAVSANDCLKAVKEANHFTSTNVIYMQYVLDTIGFGGLSEKCVEYAKGQDALCYHKVQTENGLIVHIHVPGNLSNYKQRYIEKIKQTVAEIVECTVEKIQVGGIRPSDSFLIVLFLKNVSLRKLWTMKQQDKDKLLRLNIDYIVADLNFVFLERSKDLESQWKMYFGPKIRRQYTKDTHWKEAEMIMPTVAEKPTESQTPEEKKLKKTLDYNTSEAADREKIIHMYETVLNHTFQGKLENESEANDPYDFGKWEKAKTTYLVYTVDDEDPKLIKNIPGNKKGNHAEKQFIEEWIKQGKVKEPGVTDKFEEISSHKKNEKSKSLKTKKENIHVTIYMNNSPCSQSPHNCADELIDMLNNNENVHLRLYVANLYNIRRESCQEEYHNVLLGPENHEANYRGLRNLMQHDRCEIMAFTEDIWKELFQMTTGSDQLPDDYDNIEDGNERSRKDEDERIQTDLDHIRNQL